VKCGAGFVVGFKKEVMKVVRCVSNKRGELCVVFR